MKIDADEEEGCTISMHVPDESAIVYVSADVSYGGKSGCNIGGIVYS